MNQIECDPCSSPLTHEPDPFVMVLFGATGDLSRRKLMPAFYSLVAQGLLSRPYAIIAFARRDGSDASYREDVRSTIREFGKGLPIEGRVWDSFAANLYYHQAEMDNDAGYDSLAARLDGLALVNGVGANRLFYGAIPPDKVVELAEHLGTAGLVHPFSTDPGAPWARVIVEKPFGRDLNSALDVNARLRSVFSEEQIFRIDHYLGKETVQNILVLRFGNKLYELLWNQSVIDHVQITMGETLGVEGRGGYFDTAGMTRDVIQNHVLQILTLIAMEPPVNLDADSVRDEKVKVLKSLRPFSPGDVARYAVRGQYTDGIVNEGPGHDIDAVGYTREKGVRPHSRTETFAAFRFLIDNWRWAGVPFYVRAGKRMPLRTTEVSIELKAIPDVLFARMECARVNPNRLTFRIQPDEGIVLRMSAKEPGTRMRVQPVEMRFDYADEFNKPIPDAYERLILDAILGEAALFARADEVEAAWTLMGPILEGWDRSPNPPEPYFAGTWGPRGADELLQRDGRSWHNSTIRGSSAAPFSNTQVTF